MKAMRIVTVVVCLVLLLVSCSAGKPKATLEEYNAAVAEFNDATMQSAIALSNIAQYENSYWGNLIKLGGPLDYDNIASSAFDWFEEKTGKTKQTVEQDYNDICVKYKELISMDVDDDATRVSEKVDELFEAYNSLYLLVCKPSGDNDSFVRNYNEYSEVIISANSLLATLLSE